MTVLRGRTQSCRTISIAPGRGIHALPVREACRVWVPGWALGAGAGLGRV